MKKILHKILFFICAIFSSTLILSYLAGIVDPNIFYPPALLALAYPYLLGINTLFVVYWIFRKKWSFLFPLITILIGYNNFNLLIQFKGEYKEATEESFKITSYNVRFFDKYNWSGNKSTPQKIINLLKESHSDIICIQEYGESKKSILSKKNISKALNLKHIIIGKSDLVIFSRYPIIHKSEILFSPQSHSKAIYADFLIHKDTIRIYNIHLESNRFVKKNYKFIKKKDYSADKENLDEIKDISSRLKNAFKLRAKQAILLKKHMNKCPYEFIIAGDFNDTSSSFTYTTIAKNIHDSFVENGWGLGITYKGDFPSFRIDYILFSDNISCLTYDRIKRELSDHYPIKGVYSVNRK